MSETPSLDAHVHLDTHPTHPSAVQAVLTGSQAHIALMALEAAGWSAAASRVLVLARIDQEEPYWAADAAKHLVAGGITVEITPRLQEAIDEEWTWPDYPMPWCTRSEIREVSHQAQKVHDDIRNGQLLIHAHDGHTTVAVGTYLHPGGTSVHLHGEDHLRQVAETFDSPAQALLAFEKVHSTEMHPGPAPLTATERAAVDARSVFDVTTAKSATFSPRSETVPVYLADAGDHDALLDTFLDAHAEFEKWRTWSDDTTHAIHESQTLRIERVHETLAHETAWTVAAYETPVSDRMWHLTLTDATPSPLLETLLNSLAEGDAWETAIGSPITEKTVTQATRPLTSAGWKHTIEGRWIRWETTRGDAGVQFNAFAAQNPSGLPTWTLWAGASINHPTWAIHASAYTVPPFWPDSPKTWLTAPAPALHSHRPALPPRPHHPAFRLLSARTHLADARDEPARASVRNLPPRP